MNQSVASFTEGGAKNIDGRTEKMKRLRESVWIEGKVSVKELNDHINGGDEGTNDWV